MKAYKLTDKNGYTKNNTQWGPGVTHTAQGSAKTLCSSGWIHFYRDPLLAILMNPVHANFKEPILWECETSGEELHQPDKSGCKTLTTIKQIKLPAITETQIVAFAILSAKKVNHDISWNNWADNWLTNKDRTAHTAYDAAYAAYASCAASCAAYAANAAANAAFCAAYAATYAVANTANAAYAANAKVDSSLDLIAIAHEAMKY